MPHVFHFKSAKFDLTKEPPNPINPLGGQGVLFWLRDHLSGSGFTASEPGAEDWGWYIDVMGAGQKYLVGASADAHEPIVGETVEWAVQVVKSRSLKDNLFGKNKQTEDDPLAALIESLFRAEPEICELEVEFGA
jgi:hypothetical protein